MLYYIGIAMGIYAGLTLLLALVGNFSKLARFGARLLVAYVLMVVCALYGVFASIFLRLIGEAGLSQWTVARAFNHTMCPATGVRFEVENEEGLSNQRPVVFVGNHQSELDVLVLARIWPKYCSVTAKSSLKHAPFLGWFMSLSGTVFIDRANRQSAMTAFDNAVKDMKSRNQSVWLFPEGTRSYSEAPIMLPFKKGAFHLAVQAQVPIVPVVVQNYSHVLNLKKLSFEKGTIKVKVLDPISTVGLTNSKEDIDALLEKTRSLMVTEIEAMGMGGDKKSN